MVAFAVLSHVSFLFRDDTGFLDHRRLPSLAATVTEGDATLHVGGTSITVRLV
jgi:hypothetical protein